MSLSGLKAKENQSFAGGSKTVYNVQSIAILLWFVDSLEVNCILWIKSWCIKAYPAEDGYCIHSWLEKSLSLKFL